MRIQKLIMLLLLPLFSLAQNNANLTGHISDIKNKPVSNAKISLLKQDGAVIINAYSDSTGFYKISYNGTDAMIIKCELQRYEAETKPINNSTVIDFQLFENVNINLNEVTVKAKTPIVEYKADRAIFNVEKSISAIGGDAVDAIKKAPGVMVTRDEINIAGKNSVAVMIDGRLQQLSGDDLMQMLHSIPSDNISKIEVITSPSSKYDAEGNAGIINLILKKNKQKGFTGRITASHEYNTGLHFPTGNTSLNYKKGDLNLFCNAGGGRQGYPYTAYTDTYYPDQFSHQDVKYPYINPFARIQSGGDYMINKKSTIGFMVNEAFSWLHNDESIKAQHYDLNNQPESIVTTIGKTTDKYLGKLTTNLNYEFRFDSIGKKMNIDLDYYRQRGDRHRNVITESNIVDGPNVSQASRVTSSPLTKIMSATVDFEMPVKNMRWNYGIKASGSKNVLNNLYEIKNGNDYVNDATKTNQFSYREEIQAAYVSVNKAWKKFEINAGLRAERTRGKGFGTASQDNSVDYTKLFPSATVQYNLNESHSLNLSFAKRISRPNYVYLNPFRFYFTPNTFVEGNPDLQPAFNHLTKLGYTYKSSLSVTLLYNHIKNYFDRVYTVDTIHQTNAVSRKNLGTKEVIAFEVNYSLQPTKWWELTGNINTGHVLFSPVDKSGKAEYNALNWWAEATNNFYLNNKKTFSAELSGYYYSPRQRDVVHWAEMYAVNFSLRYQLLNKNLIIAFSGDDIFATSFWLQTNKLNNTEEYSYDGHSYRISCTFKFGNKNIKARQIKSMEEIQRTGTLQ